MPVADLLRLDPRHAIRVVGSGDGHRAEPVTRDGDGWRRSHPGDGCGAALVRRLYDGAPVPDGFRLTVPDRPASTLDRDDEHPITVDQTNESWVVGGRVVVKWVTEPLVGPHPAAERLRRLAEARFAETPALWGLVEWRAPDTGLWVPVALALAHVAGAEDGWTWAVADARRAIGAEPGVTPVEGDIAGELGALTARLHLALADEPPDTMSSALARAHADEARGALDLAVRLVEPHDPESHALLTAHRPRIEAALAELAEATGIPVLPVHGDLHVGQVLRESRGGYAVIDFDGNPTRSPELRAAHAPAALDVAGMLICLENVGHVARRAAGDVEGPEAATFDWAALAWTSHAQARFLSDYREALGDRAHLYDESLVPAYAWEQLCREIVYAARHLPEWLYVPAASLRRRFAEESR